MKHVNKITTAILSATMTLLLQSPVFAERSIGLFSKDIVSGYEGVLIHIPDSCPNVNLENTNNSVIVSPGNLVSVLVDNTNCQVPPDYKGEPVPRHYWTTPIMGDQETVENKKMLAIRLINRNGKLDK